MALKAFEEFLEEPLILPIGGKEYTVPPVNAVDGVRLSETFLSVQSGDDGDVEGETELDMYRRVLGSAYDELVADGVPFPALVRAGKTALYDFMAGREAAENFWNTGSLAGKPVGKAPQDHKTSTNTGAASKTRKPASTTGTNSRPKSPSKPTPAK